MGETYSPRLKEAFEECDASERHRHHDRAIWQKHIGFWCQAGARIVYNTESPSRVKKLEDALSDALARIAVLEARQTLPSTQPTAHGDPCLADVIEITQRMFGTPEVSLERDPSDPDMPFVVFTVYPQSQPNGFVDKRIEWHNIISKVRSAGSGPFRLSIVPRE